MKRFSIMLLCTATFAAACTGSPLPRSGPVDPLMQPESARRLAVYEVMIRTLADSEKPEPILVLTDLCAQLMGSEIECSDQLSRSEQVELSERLSDLGRIVFFSNDDSPHRRKEPYQEILLGPIEEKTDGLRVEGAVVCGGLCGTGRVYVVVANANGYEVTGTDDRYGAWVA